MDSYRMKRNQANIVFVEFASKENSGAALPACQHEQLQLRDDLAISDVELGAAGPQAACITEEAA